MIYAGGAFAMFAGLNYLERVTGVSQGLSDEAGQAIATGAAAGAVGGVTAGLMGKTLQMAGKATSRFGAVMLQHPLVTIGVTVVAWVD